MRSLPFLVVGGGLFVSTFFLPHAYGEPNDPVTETSATTTSEIPIPNTTSATDTIPVAANSDAFIGSPVFKENEQSQVLLNPVFNDNSTNIAFYMKCPNIACPGNGTPANPEYVFSAENLGHGTLPFSDYWAPPALTDFIAIEYKNDSQQFTCSDKTLEVCKADPHFVAITNFAIVSSSTVITPEMIAAKSIENTVPVQTTSSTPSAALTALSVNLSAASISSNLEAGTMVTATLDGTSTTTTTPELAGQASTSSPLASVGSFLAGVVNTIIDAILPGDQSGKTSTDTPATISSESSSTSTPTNTTSKTPADTPTSTAPSPSDTTPAPAPADATPVPTPTPTDTPAPAVTTPTPDTTTSNEPVTSQF
jgi:hypothetical protein